MSNSAPKTEETLKLLGGKCYCINNRECEYLKAAYHFAEVDGQGRLLGCWQVPLDEVSQASGIEVERPLLLRPVPDTQLLVANLLVPSPNLRSHSFVFIL